MNHQETVEKNGKEIKIAVLQEQMRIVQVDVTKILDNHLPHLQKAIDDSNVDLSKQIGKLNIRMAWFGGGLTAVWAVIQIVIAYIN